jgi:hypothetical protein
MILCSAAIFEHNPRAAMATGRNELPTYRLEQVAAPVVRAACLIIAALALAACGNEQAAFTDSTPSKAFKPAALGAGKVSGTGSVTLSWTPPSQNVDGTPLQDLAGYRVYYSQAPWGWTSSLNVPDPGVTTVQIPNLSAGTWYFMVSAYNATGAESNRTDPVTKML